MAASLETFTGGERISWRKCHFVRALILLVCAIATPWQNTVAAGASRVGRNIQTAVELSVSLLLGSKFDDVELNRDDLTDALNMAVHDTNNDLCSKQNDIWRMRIRVPNASENRLDLLGEALQQVRSYHSLAFIGLTSDEEIPPIASLAGLLGIPAISLGTGESYQQPSDLHPTLWRALPSNAFVAGALSTTLAHFSWRKVCVLHSSPLSYIYKVLTSVKQWHDITVLHTVHIKLEQDGSLSRETRQGVADLRPGQCRVLVADIQSTDLQPLLEAADEERLLEKGYAWVFLPLSSELKGLSNKTRRLLDGCLLLRPRLPETNLKRFLSLLKIWRGNFDTTADVRSLTTLRAAYAYDAMRLLGESVQEWLSMPGETPHLNHSGQFVVGDTIKLTPWSQASGLMTAIRSKSKTFRGIMGKTRFPRPPPLDTFDILNLQFGKLVQIATWAKSTSPNLPVEFWSKNESGFWTGGTRIVPSDSADYENKTLNVLVPISFPFTFLRRDPPEVNEDFAGVAIDFFRKVAQKAGFNYTLTLWNGSWDALVKVAGSHSNDVDIAVGSITITRQRSRWARFTKSFFQVGLRILVKRPQVTAESPWKFLLPFHWHVWLLLLATVLISAFVFQVVDPDGVRTERNKSVWTDSLYFSFGVICSAHETDVRRFWGKVYLLVLQFVTLVLIAGYTANMVVFLSAEPGQ